MSWIRTYQERDIRDMRRAGLTLPSNPVAARGFVREASSDLRTPGMLQDTVQGFFNTRSRMRLDSLRGAGLGDFGTEREQQVAEDMRLRRQGFAGGSTAQLAWPKERDPFMYWTQKQQWFKPEEDDPKGEHMKKMRAFCRLLYVTHPLIPSLIDIYTRFPLLDIEFKHKDEKLAEFYTDLFLNELHYHEHLFDLGREHWTVGEAFSLASWHDGIGAWDAEDLINPNDVDVGRHPALRMNQYRITVPEEIKRLIDTRNPPEDYAMLEKLYPDVIQWAMHDQAVPVSDVLMKQVKFKTDPWTQHGTPILLRAFRQLMLEESLFSAQDAVADRFYSPLILARLGLDNVDQDGPWIPEFGELEALRNDLNMALSSDFRLMVYHHGLDIKSVFGREQMPKLDQDFDRIDRALMGVFGIGEELLRGGKSNTAYASGALNRELITQLLETYQVYIRRFMQERMAPVAERQGLYEYVKAGDQRRPIMETVLVEDEETGEQYVEERPKLAIPEVNFKTMNLRDEKVERDFLKQLKDQGWPISDQSMAVNIPIDFDEELDRVKEEKLRKVIAEQQFKKELFERLLAQQLPIPQEYQVEYNAWVTGAGDTVEIEEIPDITEGPPTHNLAPSPDAPGASPGAAAGTEDTAPVETDADDSGPNIRNRPQISDEQRKDAPKAASFEEGRARRLSEIEARDGGEPDDVEDESIMNEKVAKQVADTAARPENPAVYGSRMKFGTPFEFKKRRVMKLPGGIRVATPEAMDQIVAGDVERALLEVDDYNERRDAEIRQANRETSAAIDVSDMTHDEILKAFLIEDLSTGQFRDQIFTWEEANAEVGPFEAVRRLDETFNELGRDYPGKPSV